MKKIYRAIFWDVYGTLLQAERGDLDSLLRRQASLRSAFEQTVARFQLPGSAAALHEQFLARIQQHRAAGRQPHPEIRIEAVWTELIPAGIDPRAVALFFEQHANPKSLQPHAVATLAKLHQRGLRQGIISNAQFYTPLELAALFQQDTVCQTCRYEVLFEPQLVFLSCDLGVAKPDPTAFRRACDLLAADGIAPGDCLMIGDSPSNDIAPARAIGFDALLYQPGGVPGPDVITSLAELPGRL